MYVHACISQLEVSLGCCSSGYFTDLELLRLDWLASQSLRICLSHPQSWNIRAYHSAQLLLWVLGIKLRILMLIGQALS